MEEEREEKHAKEGRGLWLRPQINCLDRKTTTMADRRMEEGVWDEGSLDGLDAFETASGASSVSAPGWAAIVRGGGAAAD